MKFLESLTDSFLIQKKNTSALMEVITVNVQEILGYLENTNNIKFNGNTVFAMAHFLYYKGNSPFAWTNEQKKIDKSDRA
ncbi:hypothetical protein RWE15_03830 [Virgibacillus halophilus]|uniref:Uncharacterized protein n=1 Tax=Tigheibacillus halophilus TaxID=361280 RepID=A0ABU5C3T6_9BACI|nr:hypothetical protein [Virgibacillus halophilus]